MTIEKTSENRILKARPDAWKARGENSGLPLEGIRVLELAAIIAGSFTGVLLADFGADVIKVEHPDGDPIRKLGNTKDGVSFEWKRLGRNKRLVTLDLHDRDAQQVIRDLAAEADVVTENFRPGTLERWNIGYEQLRENNPGLVMLRVTGWGQNGPHKDRPGFGSVAEAMGGFAALNGENGGSPLLPPFGVADNLSGVYGAFAVMVALREREKSGLGQNIDLALYESIFSILGSKVTDYDKTGFIPPRLGNRVYYSSPRNVYGTSDGRYIAISGSTPAIAKRILIAIGRPELFEDERFHTNAARLKNADELDAIIAQWIKARPFREVMETFEREQVAVGPIQDVSHIVDDEQFLARETILRVADEDWGDVLVPNVVPRLSRTPGSIRWPGRNKIGRNQDEIVD